jgi:tape measure domain-containing protein
MSERIDIEITDKVSPTPRRKILQLAEAARQGQTALMKLQKAIGSLDASALNKLVVASNKTRDALTKETNANAKLINAKARMIAVTQKQVPAQERLAQSYAKTEAELNKAIRTEAQAKTATQKLTQETAKAAQAQERLQGELQQTALKGQRVSTEMQRTAAAESRAGAAADRASIASLRLKQAQDKIANSSNRARVGLGGFIRTALAFAGIGFGGAQIVQAADSYTILQNKLKNVTDSEEQLLTVSQKVFEVANKTRTPVQDTAQAFQRFDRALQGLGASQQESLQLTESVNKALVLSGSTTGEQSAALLQLSQAFNKGKLDGDEFRTVMELMPAVADAIAKEMGVARGELLKLAPQGKITASVMRSAFANAKDSLDKGFAKTIPTLGQSLTVLKNKATDFFGEIAKQTGFVNAMSGAILGLSNNLNLLGPIAATAGASMLVAFGPRILLAIRSVGTAIKALTVTMAANPIGAIAVALTASIALLYTFRNSIKTSADGIVTLGDTVQSVFGFIWDSIKGVGKFIGDTFLDAISFVENLFDGLLKTVSSIAGQMWKVMKRTFNNLIGGFVSLYKIAKETFKALPALAGDAGALAANAILDSVQSATNFINKAVGELVDLINRARKLLGNDPLDFEANIIDLSSFKLQVGNSAKELGDVIQKEVTDAIEVDYIGNFVGLINDGLNEIQRRAREIGEARRKTASDALRGAGKAPLSSDDSDEKKAKILEKLNRELQTEFRLLGMVGKEREAEARFSAINNNLLNKGIKLTETQTSVLKAKIAILQDEKNVQSELQSLYDSSVGSFQQLADRLEANNRAYERGIINQDTYNRNLVQMNSEARQLKMTLGDGTWADAWQEGLNKITEGYQGFIPAMSEAFGGLFVTLTQGFANSIGQAIVYAENLGDALKNVAKTAVAQLISSVIQAGIQFVAMEGVKQESLGATILATNAEAANKVAAISTITAAQLAALATSSAANVAAGIASSQAWTPAAIAASIATFGGASVAGTSALIAGTTASKAAIMATGFKDGGYTGNDVGRNQIAGVVHGEEYVMKASAVQRIGVGNLEALSKGAARVQQNTPIKTYENSSNAPTSSQNGEKQGNVVNLKTVNVLDPSLVGDYLDSSDSDEVFLNKIGRNSEEIRTYLGV